MDAEGIWIESTRGPDDEPVCCLTWGPLQWYAPVDDVRATAIDLVACAAYAEMMMRMVVRAGIPPETTARFATDLLSDNGREQFGRGTTLSLMPAGSSKRKQALVLLGRGSQRASVYPDEARKMALDWLEVAEGTESDQLVSEALRGAGIAAGDQDRVFGYLRELRAKRDAAP